MLCVSLHFSCKMSGFAKSVCYKFEVSLGEKIRGVVADVIKGNYYSWI